MLILYLLNLFIGSNSFCVASLGFSRESITSSAHNDNFTASLLTWISFISFTQLLWLGASHTMLNRSESGHPCCVLKFCRKGFSFSRWVLCWLWVSDSFYYAEICLYTISVKAFIMNGCWILPNTFSASTEMIIWFLCFLLLMWYIILIVLHTHHYYGPGVNPTWPGVRPFVEDFCICIHPRYWPIIFLSGTIFVWFWYQGDGGFTEWL